MVRGYGIDGQRWSGDGWGKGGDQGHGGGWSEDRRGRVRRWAGGWVGQTLWASFWSSQGLRPEGIVRTTRSQAPLSKASFYNSSVSTSEDPPAMCGLFFAQDKGPQQGWPTSQSPGTRPASSVLCVAGWLPARELHEG